MIVYKNAMAVHKYHFSVDKMNFLVYKKIQVK